MSEEKSKIIQILNALKPQIRQKIDDLKDGKQPLQKSLKSDKSPVTVLDQFISKLFYKTFLQEFSGVNFLSEEEEEKRLSFPLFILDPVDGTKEFIENRDEWVISFGLYHSSELADPRNFSWIYNPLNLFEISSERIINPGNVPNIEFDQVLVSRTEYQSGLHEDENALAVGSIAYKLGLFAAGHGKKVVSKRDKNVWDIAAGTHICLKNNIQAFQGQKEFNEIQDLLIKSPFTWTRIKD